MQGTNRIYEEPSRLSQGLVAGLSVAVVLMAGWLALKISFSQPDTPPPDATDAAQGHADTAAGPPGARAVGTVSGPNAQRQETPSSVFDWPAEFAAAPAPPPPRTVLPLAPELPATRDIGRAPWPAAPAMPEPRDRSAASRQTSGAEATDAIVDLLAPPPRGTAARDAAAAAPRQAPRRQKPLSQPLQLQPQPRADSDAAQ
jgi:hypothetical protein